MPAWPHRQAAFVDLHQKLWDWEIHNSKLHGIVDKLEKVTQITEDGVDLITKLLDGAIQDRNQQIAKFLNQQVTKGVLTPAPTVFEQIREKLASSSGESSSIENDRAQLSQKPPNQAAQDCESADPISQRCPSPPPRA